jgi:Zn finger protein HypA/HybF involved in hydrogenase expression
VFAKSNTNRMKRLNTNKLDSIVRMQARFKQMPNMEFEEYDVELRCPKCSDWFALELHTWKHECPNCGRPI